MFFKKKINLDNILICIGKKSSDYTVSIPYIDDLVLYFVIDDKYAFQTLDEKQFYKIGMSIDQLKERAVENLKNRIYKIYKQIPLLKNERDDVIIPYDADEILSRGYYNFWSSLVLIPEFWDKNSNLCLNKEWDSFYIGMPCRNYLIVGNGKNEASKNEIVKLINDFEKNKEEEINSGNFEAKREISNKLFVMENGSLKVNKL